jgi:hypothetical protein
MNAIKINDLRHEETGWKRYIHFTRDGEDYELHLFWDEFSGYEIYWRSPLTTPQWVIEWDEEAHNGNSFGAYLDELTWEMK